VDSKTLKIEGLNFTQHLEFQYKYMSSIFESIGSKSLKVIGSGLISHAPSFLGLSCKCHANDHALFIHVNCFDYVVIGFVDGTILL
jgi:hypothetical protein